MSCCPRETSSRSFHSPRSIPQVARCREVALRAALPSPRRPGVIHSVTPPGSVPTHTYRMTPGSVLLDPGAASRRPAFYTLSFRMTAMVSHVFCKRNYALKSTKKACKADVLQADICYLRRLEATVETCVTVLSLRAELLLDTDELVVLSHTVCAAHRTSLDLTAVCSNCDVSNSGVLSLA